MKRTDDVFRQSLADKKIPILTLDNKWHRLFTQTESNPRISMLEKQLNELLKRQGKINTETKDIKKLKKRLMDEIVETVDSMEQAGNNSALDKKVEENKRLINECNEKLDAYRDENLDLPKMIQEVNYELMLATMQVCYDEIQENSKEIDSISAWLVQVRIELKKNIIRKQEKEVKNHELYSYMHDIFGADVIEIFDMKYNPEEKHPKVSPKKEKGK